MTESVTAISTQLLLDVIDKFEPCLENKLLSEMSCSFCSYAPVPGKNLAFMHDADCPIVLMEKLKALPPFKQRLRAQKQEKARGLGAEIHKLEREIEELS